MNVSIYFLFLVVHRMSHVSLFLCSLEFSHILRQKLFKVCGMSKSSLSVHVTVLPDNQEFY